MKGLQIAMIIIVTAVGTAAALYAVMDNAGLSRAVSVSISAVVGLVMLWIVGYGVRWSKWF